MIRKPFRYFGGKGNVAPWIVQQMPPHIGYMEPFAGLLAVLLAKPRAGPEVVNDTNHWLINWWRQVRDQPQEMARLTRATPWARVVYEEAITKREAAGNRKAEGLDDALTFQVIVQQNVLHGWEGNVSLKTWGRDLSSKSIGHFASSSELAKRIVACGERLDGVQIECRDALEVIAFAKHDTLIYCDPPYHSSEIGPYGDFTFEQGAFREALLASPSMIMLSGYPGEWDDLGWQVTYKATARLGQIKDKKPDALYCNFEPQQRNLGL